MLIDVAFGRPDPQMHAVFSIIAGGGEVQPQRLQTGVYRCDHFNMEDLITWRHVETYPEWPMAGDDWMSAYGVCDSPEQLLEVLGEKLADPLRLFVVSLTPLRRADQSPEGGWRWHKWGPYIGTQEPQMEYLYDEPEIEEVWTYHVYELVREQAKAPQESTDPWKDVPDDPREPCGECSACHNNQPCLDPS